jgi:hypothetical protein
MDALQGPEASGCANDFDGNGYGARAGLEA